LVPVEEYRALAVAPEQLKEIIAENVGALGASEFDLDRVSIPTGGGTAWSVPTIEGEELVKEIAGIIVMQRDARAYWERSLDESGGGTPPDCTSTDGLVGYGLPGGDCTTCELAKFGSKSGGRKGQACKQMKQLFMLRPDTLLPMVVNLPPTSVAPIRKYMLRLASDARPYYAVITRLTLEKVMNGGGVPYARAVPSVAGPVPDEQLPAIRSYMAALKPVLARTVAPAESEYEG